VSVYVWLCYNEREREKEQIQMKGLMCGTRWVVWVFCFVLFCFVLFIFSFRFYTVGGDSPAVKSGMKLVGSLPPSSRTIK